MSETQQEQTLVAIKETRNKNLVYLAILAIVAALWAGLLMLSILLIFPRAFQVAAGYISYGDFILDGSFCCVCAMGLTLHLLAFNYTLHQRNSK